MKGLYFEENQDGGGYLEWIEEGIEAGPATGKVGLSNSFHNSSCIVIPKNGLLSPGQVRRAKNILCGIKGCTCSNAAGMR